MVNGETNYVNKICYSAQRADCVNTLWNHIEPCQCQLDYTLGIMQKDSSQPSPPNAARAASDGDAASTPPPDAAGVASSDDGPQSDEAGASSNDANSGASTAWLLARRQPEATERMTPARRPRASSRQRPTPLCRTPLQTTKAHLRRRPTTLRRTPGQVRPGLSTPSIGVSLSR